MAGDKRAPVSLSSPWAETYRRLTRLGAAALDTAREDESADLPLGVTAAVSGRPASETDLIQQRPAGLLSGRGQASSGLAVLSPARTYRRLTRLGAAAFDTAREDESADLPLGVTAAVSGLPASETDLIQQRPAGRLSGRGHASSGPAVLSPARTYRRLTRLGAAASDTAREDESADLPLGVTAAVSGRPASETGLIQQRPAGLLSDRGHASSGPAVLSPARTYRRLTRLGAAASDTARGDLG